MHFPVLSFLQNIHTVSFSKPGFVELQPVSFDVGTEINLSFSTRNESGIILFGTSGTIVPPRRKRRHSARKAAPLRRKRRQTGQVRGTWQKTEKPHNSTELPRFVSRHCQMFMLKLKFSYWEKIISNVILYVMKNLTEAQNWFFALEKLFLLQIYSEVSIACC